MKFLDPSAIEEFKRDCEKWHRRQLIGKFAHWCFDWDGLPIDETCGEFQFCTCFTPEELAS